MIPVPEETRAQVLQKLESLSLIDKVGQLFVFGFKGTEMNSYLKRRLQVLRPGGVIIFQRNIQSSRQISKLNQEIQWLSQKHIQLPSLIMVDQEGGSVVRIKTNPTQPSALALGMSHDTALVREVGHLTGRLLALLGFNMNLAPVLDLSNPQQQSFISNRSFGENPEEVKFVGEAFSSGLMDSGIVPTAKHFPGHGKVLGDSHHSLPTNNETFEQLEKSAFVPFEWFARFQYPSAIMVAHMSFPKIDPSGTPATFSKVILKDLLRTRLQYEGLVISDDMEMAGANAVGDIGERAVKSLIAGCDLVMVAWTPSKQFAAFRSVLAAAKSGRLPQSRIDESVARILTLKFTLQSLASQRQPTSNPSLQFSSIVDQLKDLSNRVTLENFNRSIKSYPHLSASSSGTEKVMIFSSDVRFYYGFRNHWGNQTHLKILRPGEDPMIALTLENHPESLGVYYATGAKTANFLNRLDTKIKRRLLVVNTTHPGEIFQPQAYLAVINLNAKNYRSGAWLANFLKPHRSSTEENQLPVSEPKQPEASDATKSHQSNS